MMWKPTLTVLCCFFLVVSSYQKVKGQPSSPTPPPIAAEQVSLASPTCPTCNTVRYDLGINEIAEKFIELFPKVWYQVVPLSALGTRFVTYIRNLNLDSGAFTALAGVFSSFVINNFIANLGQKPDACAMAAMINATVSCVVDRNRTLIQDALTQVQDSYLYDISPRLERTMALRAGCDFRCGEYPPDTKVNKTVCYENGFVYPIQQVLDLPRNEEVSPSFKTFLLQMYNSTDFNDKFFAVSSTFAISGVPFELWNGNIMSEIIDLTTSLPTQKNCCYQRITRVEEIRKIYDADVKSYITYMRQNFTATHCK